MEVCMVRINLEKLTSRQKSEFFTRIFYRFVGYFLRWLKNIGMVSEKLYRNSLIEGVLIKFSFQLTVTLFS